MRILPSLERWHGQLRVHVHVEPRSVPLQTATYVWLFPQPSTTTVLPWPRAPVVARVLSFSFGHERSLSARARSASSLGIPHPVTTSPARTIHTPNVFHIAARMAHGAPGDSVDSAAHCGLLTQRNA